MKKHLPLFIALILLMINASAQMTNLNFESWTTSSPSYPTEWRGSTISQETVGAQQGNSFARIVTTTTANGSMFVGTFITPTTFKSGVLFNQKPTALNGFYKTSGLATGDSAMIVFFSLRGNPASLVTYGSFVETTNKSTWTSFSIPLTYPGSVTPDTATIFVASNPKPMGYGANSLNSTIDVDNFSFTGLTGIDEKTIGTSFLAFPNPANKEFTIVSKNEEAVSVLISDISGKIISTEPIEYGNASINLDNYVNGVYFYTIVDKNKVVLFTSKFVVSK